MKQKRGKSIKPNAGSFEKRKEGRRERGGGRERERERRHKLPVSVRKETDIITDPTNIRREHYY